VKAREARIILDIVWPISNQIKYLNEERIVVLNDNMKLLNKINFGIVKSLEYAQEAATPISEILRIVRRSIIKFKLLYTLSHIVRISSFNENQSVYLMQQYYLMVNKTRREVQLNKQKQNLDVRGDYNVRVNGNLYD